MSKQHDEWLRSLPPKERRQLRKEWRQKTVASRSPDVAALHARHAVQCAARVAEWTEAEVVRLVERVYTYSHDTDPTVTATTLFRLKCDDMDEERAYRRAVVPHIDRLLRKLVRMGKLEVSIGMGERGECKAYSPARGIE